MGLFLENTDEDFAKKKIDAHYKTKDRILAKFALPIALFLSNLFHKQNKMVILARKI